MKRFLLIFAGVLFAIFNLMADITISVPKKWKNQTLYIWQTDINQVFSRQDDEPIHQIKDTIKISDLTFTIPIKLDCATKVNILSPKKDETDYDHTIAEACIVPGEDVLLHLDDNTVIADGSILNKQMAEIYTHYLQSLPPYRKAYEKGNPKEASRLAALATQWYVDYIKSNSTAPAAGAALYQLTDPKLVVELGTILQGEALTSIYYPYAENHINRCKKILERKEAQRSLSETRKDAPNFSLNDISGNKVSLSDFKGQWVIIDFWGSWCRPCIKGMPELKEIYEKYAGKIEIIGIACNDTEESWKNAVSRLELPWVQLFQIENDSVTSAYEISAFPTKVIINPEGSIQKIYTGESPSFMEDLAELLK